jgi:hypothetical protein
MASSRVSFRLVGNSEVGNEIVTNFRVARHPGHIALVIE